MGLEEIKESVDRCKQPEIVGLIGINPTTYSKSRIMWNAAFALHGLPLEYIPFDVKKEELPEVLDFLIANQRIRGFNITVPYKEPTSLRPEIEVDAKARATGGINTVHRLNGKLYGHSTDGYGATTAIEEVLYPGCLEGRQVLILGAGGSGSAIAMTYAKQGAHVTVANRNQDKLQELEKRAEGERKADGKKVIIKTVPLFAPDGRIISSQLESEMLVNASIIVNTVDERKSGRLFPDELFKRDPNFMEVYMDIGYGEGIKFYFLESARKAGHYITLDGEPMLIHQADEAFGYICALEKQSRGFLRKDIVKPMRWAFQNFKFNTPNREIAEEVDRNQALILR